MRTRHWTRESGAGGPGPHSGSLSGTETRRRPGPAAAAVQPLTGRAKPLDRPLGEGPRDSEGSEFPGPGPSRCASAGLGVGVQVCGGIRVAGPVPRARHP
jgi:hypothetical protein